MSHIISEIKISYQPNIDIYDSPKINSSQDAYQLFWENYDDAVIGYREQFKIMLLNRANRVLGIANISSGGLSNTIADPRIIFGIALKTAASGIIASHNHPSGQLTPSHHDIQLTDRLKKAGHLLSIPVIDHLILSPQSGKYYSFADECML